MDKFDGQLNNNKNGNCENQTSETKLTDQLGAQEITISGGHGGTGR
jgi:hypothetical protein